MFGQQNTPPQGTPRRERDERTQARERKLDTWERTGVNPDYVDARGQAREASVEVDGERVSVHSPAYRRWLERKLRG